MREIQKPDVNSYRKTMGLFATGVTILTTTTLQSDPIAMTANAITSVSLNPLLLLVCVWEEAEMAKHIQKAPNFSLSILKRDQQDISNYFASIWPENNPPPDFSFSMLAGTPHLKECMAAFSCKRRQIVNAGDHLIVIGEVNAIVRNEDSGNAPLVFYKGDYHHISEL